MKIFVWGINYYPELTGIGVYNIEMCEYLRTKGHSVTMFTAFPYYPQWKIQREYRRKFFRKENHNRTRVRRSYVYVPQKVTAKTRILHELSFVISSFLNLLFSGHPDIIIVISPPLLLGVSAYIVSKLKRVPFIFHIQDLQPDAAVELSMIKSKILIKLLYRIEKFIYEKAALVSTISPSMQKRIIAKGINKNKVIFFPNWVDTDFIEPLQKQNMFRMINNIEKKFLVLYSGNIGMKQGLEIVLQAANLLRESENILFCIAGNGVQKESLEKMSQELNLSNVMFLPVQPKEMLSEMLSAADVTLVIQKSSVTDVVLPSKLLGILASGRAVIASAPSGTELDRVVRESGCGLVIEAGNPFRLRDAILDFYDSEEKREICGKNGRQYVCEHFSKERVLGEFEKEIKEIKR